MRNWKQSLIALALAAASLLSLTPSALAADQGAPAGVTLGGAEHYAYISGDGGRFRPEGTITRAEAAQIICRLLTRPVPVTVSYLDVPGDAWYAQAAGILGSLGVMRAGQSLFLPEEQLSRGEFIRTLAGFFPAAATTIQFADVAPWDPNGSYYLTARSLGWLNGFEDGTLRPEQAITRAEAVTVLNRALGRTPDKAYIDAVNPILYLDVGRDSWYYYDIMEASIPHQHVSFGGVERWSGHTTVPLALEDGFHLIDGWLYCYSQSAGEMVRNASVGGFSFDAAGHFTSGSADLDARLREIVQSKTNDGMTQEQKLRALYVYTRDSFTYLRRPAYEFGVTDFMQKDALDMLSTGYGNCYSYASVFWYLARWIGYDAKIYSGTVGTNKRPHSWVEINFDGKDYIFDTELEMAYHKKGRYEIDLYQYIDTDNWVYIK